MMVLTPYTESDLPYLPLPNRAEAILTNFLAPVPLTRTSMILPVFRDGSVLMATNRRRGLEVPGGHIEPGESAAFAAMREAREEVGASFSMLVSIGFIKMTSWGERPKDWAYPHPQGYQQFFAGIVTTVDDFVETDECLLPRKVIASDARNELPPMVFAFYEKALVVLRSMGEIS